MDNKSNIFPLFLDISKLNILVVGCGNIGLRRIKTLLNFNTNITVISKEVSDEIKNNVTFYKQEFNINQIINYDIVIAATNDRKLNHQIYIHCKKNQILVNVIDNHDECDFYFPSVFENEELVGGLVSKKGNKHKLVKEKANDIRGIL